GGFFFFSCRRRHTRFSRDWSSDVCSSDLPRATSPAASDRTWVLLVALPPPSTCTVRSGDWPCGEWLLAAVTWPGSWFGSGGHERSEERRVGKGSRWRGALCREASKTGV